jgi:thiol-disulfide isomerase/thioredoxin
MDIKDFIPSRYFPADYDIVVSGQEQRQTPTVDNLTGTKAPEWTLSDTDNNKFSLNDFKSKVLLLQFSGIGCPPCHASLPFLNRLVADYKDKSFELVRVECWNNNIDAIKRYIAANDITYKFLVKDAEIEKQYNVHAVPMFFILDNNKVIQKVVRGYGGETTDKEITEAIEKLL